MFMRTCIVRTPLVLHCIFLLCFTEPIQLIFCYCCIFYYFSVFPMLVKIDLIPFTFTLLTHFHSYRLVSSSALVAYRSLGQPTGPIDPLTCQQLTLLGDHSLERSRTTLLHAGCDDLPLLCRVPSEFKNALAKAYSSYCYKIFFESEKLTYPKTML